LPASASVFFYISGHGFGHASRQIEIINALGVTMPGLPIVVRTSAPKWLFDRTARVPLTLISGECDTGVVQIDSLRLDERRTIERADQFHRGLADRVAEEATLLRDHHARLVISDAPPLACAAASVANVQSVVVSNFTWDWIYEGYAEEIADAPNLLPSIRNAYRAADAAWRLPMHGGFATFETIVDLAFVARHSRRSGQDVRATLRLPADAPLALMSFGGYGLSDLDRDRLDCLDRYEVVTTERELGRSTARRGVHVISESLIYESSLRYEDLVHAVDVVVTKPGYGIIAECVAGNTAILYTTRGRFAEYDVLVADMPRWLRCAFIDQGALRAGRWREALDRVMAAPGPTEVPKTNGAETVADLIRQRI
jgi:hypothetical protein